MRIRRWWLAASLALALLGGGAAMGTLVQLAENIQKPGHGSFAELIQKPGHDAVAEDLQKPGHGAVAELITRPGYGAVALAGYAIGGGGGGRGENEWLHSRTGRQLRPAPFFF